MPSKNELTILVKLKDLASRGFRRLGLAGDQTFRRLIAGVGRLSLKLLVLSSIIITITALWIRLAGMRLVNLAKQFDLVAKSATRFGLTAESVMEMRFAAEQSGVAMTDLKMAMQRLNRTAENVRDGNVNMKRQFEALGIEARTLFAKGGDTDLTAVLAAIAEGMSGVVSSTERVDIAFQLLGDSGPKLLTLLDGGAEKVNAFAKAARDLGQVLSKDQVEQFATFLSALDKFKAALEGVQIAIVLEIMPTLSLAFDNWANSIATNRKRIVAELLRMLVLGGRHLKAFAHIFGLALTVIASKMKFLLIIVQSMIVIFETAGALIENVYDKHGKGAAKIDKARISAEKLMKTWHSLMTSLADPDKLGRDIEKALAPFEKMLARLENFRDLPPLRDVGGKRAEPPVKELTELQKLTGGLGKGLEELRIKFADTFEVARSAAITAGNALQSGIQTQLEGIILGTTSLSDAWKEMGKVMLKILAQVIAKLITAKLTMLLLGGAFGATSSASGSAGGGGGGGGESSLLGGGSGPQESRFGGGGNTTINLTILANDTSGFDRLLQNRKRVIEDIMINALQTRRDVIVDLRG